MLETENKSVFTAWASGLIGGDGFLANALPYALNFLAAIALLIVGFWLARFVARLLRQRLEAIADFDATLIPVLTQVARYAVLVLTFVIVLGQFGVQTTSIIAVLGAAGLAIGLALQGTLQNVAAGIMLLVLRPFKVGDVIETNNHTGTVREIGLFATQLDTAQNVFIALPNSKIFGDAIMNFSRNETRRSDIAVGIGYGADVERAKEVVLGAIAKDPRAHQLPAPQVVVTGLGESSVDLDVRVWFSRQDFFPATFAMRIAIKRALDEAGIEIPFPHRQVIISAESDEAVGSRGTGPKIGPKRKTPARKRAS